MEINNTKLTPLRLTLFIIGLPILYTLYSLTDWSKQLFVEKNNDYFIPFWCGIIVFHWLSLLLIQRTTAFKKWNDFGLFIQRKGMIKLVVFYATIAIAALIFIELSLQNLELSPEKVNRLPAFFPRTTGQRTLFILSVFTASFCEEMIYRGFMIRSLENLGLNKWLAIVPAGISFVFMHGIVGYYKFWFYFIPALIFGAIFVGSKRLLPNIILHLLFDFLGIFAIYQALA